MLAGILVLIGWFLDLAVLKSVIPGSATMKANTALCFILAGISLNLQTRQQRMLTTRIAKGCAIAVSMIGLTTLSQYIFGWNLGIDEVLIRDLVAPIASDPGRMGINTAINFGLVGLGLWLANHQHLQPQRQRKYQIYLSNRIAIGQTLALVAGFIALQAAIGYIYNVRVFYQFSINTTAMAFETAVVFIVLCAGILALKSDLGWMRAITSDLIGGDVARRFIPIAILVPVVLGWLILRGYQANLYDANFAFSLMALLLVATLFGLIELNAGILNRVDYDRIRSSDRIRLSEERLQLALEGGNQGIWCLDIQTQLLTWDARCQALFGLSPDLQLTYAERLEIIHPDDRDRVSETMSIAIRECGEFVKEYRTIHPDDTICWVLSQGRGYYNAAGEPDRLLGTMMNITERKQAEADLEQRNQDLDAFVHIVAHDLKAPLRGISNLSQWIEDDLEGVLTIDTRPQMVLLRSRVRRMEATIDGLLNYARIGHVDTQIEPVFVTELLAETIDSIDPPPTFSIVIDPDLPVFHTKWLCLSQVFTNLISNGIKHHHRLDGSIYISATKRDDFYEFIVADDGPGIDPEQHEKIFEIFQAVNPQNRSDSTGIGLAIVKKIIEAEGGKIWLKSQLGEGTKFYFTLPILVNN